MSWYFDASTHGEISIIIIVSWLLASPVKLPLHDHPWPIGVFFPYGQPKHFASASWPLIAGASAECHWLLSGHQCPANWVVGSPQSPPECCCHGSTVAAGMWSGHIDCSTFQMSLFSELRITFKELLMKAQKEHTDWLFNLIPNTGCTWPILY